MNKNLKIIITSGICLLGAALIIILALFIYTSAYTATTEDTQEVNVVMNGTPKTISEYNEEIINTLSKELKDVPLNNVDIYYFGAEAIESNEPSQIIFRYSKYLGSFAEGGKVENYAVYVDVESNTITKYDYYKGGSKTQYDYASNDLTNFESYDFTNYLPKFVNNYSALIETSDDCYARIQFIDNGYEINEPKAIQELYCDQLLLYRNEDELE
jgi:hypothetical protein